MASGTDFRSFRINSQYGFPDNSWSDEHDCVPLSQRLKMLLDSKRLSGSRDTDSEKASKRPSIHPIDVAVNTEDQQCSNTLTPCSVLSKFPAKLEDFSDHNLPNLVGDDIVGALGTEAQAVKIRKEVDDEFVDDLDHVVLKERRRLLLSRKSLELTKPVMELSNPVGDETIQHMIRREKKENHYGDVGPLVVGNSTHALAKITSDFDMTSRSGKSKVIVAGSSCTKQGVTIIQENDRICSSNESFGGNGFVSGNPRRKVILAFPSTTVNIKAEPLDCCDVRKVEKDVTRNFPPNCIISVKSEMDIPEALFGDKGDQVVLQDKIKLVASRQLPNLHSSKNFECSKKTVPSVLNCSPNASEFAKPMKINRPRKKRKNGLLDHADAHKMEKDAACKSPPDCVLSVKRELEIPEGSYGDKVDHMLLRDRINLLASGEPPNLDSSRNFACLKKIVPFVPNCSSIVSELAKPIVINRPRKKRKTATDSVETALEEDAPGLLQVLIDKGVLVSEMRLYGEPESDGVLDDSEDNFSELEVVISKLFSDRQFLLKLPPLLRCTKDEKPSYCLACLLSLVEQARYLQFRKWPVEWGWCRDLQSFIFVFERHNRIVLERPEYGYATYFFELLDSLPIHWQIKRLVTAMKLTSCSRVTILENKALTVGDDLTEGEARVLTGYGWIPNSGLGTMLNYCDRVVHDRKNERDSSDWKSKIGKLLMDGYNGGTIVSTDIPKKFTGCSSAHGPEIKLELT